MKKIIKLFVLLLALQACNQTANQAQRQPESVPIVLSDSSNSASCVFLTSDEKDQVVVSWVEIDSANNKYFYFARWDHHDKAFSSPKPIPMAENASIHEEGMPKIAFKSDGTMIALYETNNPIENSRFGLSDIQYVVSIDRGKTWTAPQSVRSHDAQKVSASFANILRLDDGEVGVSWLDSDPANGHGGRPVMFARTDGTASFSEAVTIELQACQCCRTAISSDGRGNIRVLYRDILPGSVRDISVSSSTDNGKSFQKPVPFSNDQWVVDGCPHNGPSVVSNRDTTYAAWFTGSDQNGVFYAELNQNNEMFNKRCLDADGRFVQLCLLNDGTRMVAYNKNYTEGGNAYSKIILNKIASHGIFEKEISTGKSHASYPVLHPADDQNLLVAWSDDGKIYYSLVDAEQITTKKEEAATGSLAMEASVSVEITNDTDPMCGMQLAKSADVRNTLQHNGQTIGFCGPACRNQFKGD